ncbi:MAG: hypothetical protein K0R93_587 [Anaerosolibacter sp.]|jgi:glycosyltransferase involved in cell wall biosynthesis|uniref:glycosyltransferase family 4 protein n=1 Tax=Anaerosolibacter sp. TaxID=1872527 RepID=UPI002618260C|nr:glycosyltransferase family 4 protein [Anaerosolibacter sp.]MDF2545689.1 hypothetical protein [Anaerosolibacter sp.]
MKKKVLIMAGYYLPSIKGGGPIQSIKNIVDNLSDKFDFYIVAADRDLGDDKPFENITVDQWVLVGKANVYYTDISTLGFQKAKKIIDSSKCKIMYLNSFFDYKFTTIPLILNKINEINVNKIIVAPRGQFSPGALGLKSIKKKLFIKTVKMIGLYSNLCWHSTAGLEKEHIRSIFKNEINIVVANNLTANYKKLTYEKNLKKVEGELKVVFVSRIHPKKNLNQALDFFREIKGEVIFNIYGPIEDKEYWEKCKRSIASLPSNIRVEYQGVVKHEEIIKVFKKHHIFLFPTLGENFGHVISEAMIGGCPVIVSDQTPWRNLEKIGVGWDVEISNAKKYVQILQYLVNINGDKYKEISSRAFEYGKLNSTNSENINAYISLFDL